MKVWVVTHHDYEEGCDYVDGVFSSEVLAKTWGYNSSDDDVEEFEVDSNVRDKVVEDLKNLLNDANRRAAIAEQKCHEATQRLALLEDQFVG